MVLMFDGDFPEMVESGSESSLEKFVWNAMAAESWITIHRGNMVGATLRILPSTLLAGATQHLGDG